MRASAFSRPPLELGHYFPDWTSGVAALAAIAASEATLPSLLLRDPAETAAAPTPDMPPERLAGYLGRVYGYRIDRVCRATIGFGGTSWQVRRQRSRVGGLVRQHGGVAVGKQRDTPPTDRGAETREAFVPWSRLTDLRDGVLASAHQAFALAGVRGTIRCRLSHAHHSGARLRFAVAFGTAEPPPHWNLRQACLDQGVEV
ncbi:hypothetical protein [Umezawaea sp. Da 62-37]|uniref:hypothetical protein n=1 Tax=Umezawaea sp. Da 62-37 TaxID=3075927 RepID=UPI0028F6FE5D|nr:hypothetical protein [Umezawaea sp. Da 62-37]WNV82816.1 hypothetical protein RM788_32065 [Umezawaea sp. Da 62-37]